MVKPYCLPEAPLPNWVLKNMLILYQGNPLDRAKIPGPDEKVKRETLKLLNNNFHFRVVIH